MKLFSQPLEVEALKAICCGDQKTSSALLGTLADDYFFTDVGKEAFARIQHVASERTKIMSWSELVTDPCITEANRDLLKAVSTSDIKDYKGIVGNLDKYRKLRLLAEISEDITNKLTSDKVDPDEILTTMSKTFIKAKSGKQIEDCFTHIGKGSNTKETLKGILTGESIRYFPTGFQQWDDKNGGFPVGKLGTIAATSGGGKSLFINQVALNMARSGVGVCIVPLEMSKEDMLHRFLANVSDLDMGQITKSADLEDDARSKAYKDFRQFEKKLSESGTSIDLFHPPTDMTMEDVLFTVKPFHYDVVIIDYIGLLGGLEGDNQWKKMMDAARFAKRWAETNETTVICAAQLNDEEIIRYSKGIKEHSDFMLGWNAGKLTDTDNGVKIIKINSQKGRNQEQLSFYLHVDYKKMMMIDATQQEIDTYEAQAKHHSSGKFNNSGSGSGGNQPPKNPGKIDKDMYADI